MEFETELHPLHAVQRDALARMGEPVPSATRQVNTTEGSSQGQPAQTHPASVPGERLRF